MGGGTKGVANPDGVPRPPLPHCVHLIGCHRATHHQVDDDPHRGWDGVPASVTVHRPQREPKQFRRLPLGQVKVGERMAELASIHDERSNLSQPRAA
jgi:hypothetical protein